MYIIHRKGGKSCKGVSFAGLDVSVSPPRGNFVFLDGGDINTPLTQYFPHFLCIGVCGALA